MSDRTSIGARASQSIGAVAIALTLVALGGCASVDRPILYPNDHYQAVGKRAAARAVDTCMSLAREAGADARGQDVVRRTAAAGVMGGATGAVVGSFSGAVGRGLARGAAVGATAGLVSSALSPSEPSPGRRALVQRCLAVQGFEVAGWR